MEKKIGICQECGRNVYTNDLDLCKRCNVEVGAEVAAQVEEEEVEEEMPSMEDLGIEETPAEEESSPEKTEEASKEPEEKAKESEEKK